METKMITKIGILGNNQELFDKILKNTKQPVTTSYFRRLDNYHPSLGCFSVVFPWENDRLYGAWNPNLCPWCHSIQDPCMEYS